MATQYVTVFVGQEAIQVPYESDGGHRSIRMAQLTSIIPTARGLEYSTDRSTWYRLELLMERIQLPEGHTSGIFSAVFYSAQDEAQDQVPQDRYVPVTDDGENTVEVPIETDNSIMLTILASLFPGASGLKYLNTGRWHGLRLLDGKILPPGDEWPMETTFSVIYPPVIKVQESVDKPTIRRVHCQPDGTILLTTLASIYPKVCGLKYRNLEGEWRGLRLLDGKIYLPEDENLDQYDYVCIHKKFQ